MEDTLTTPANSWIVDAAKKGAILGVIHIFIHLIFYIGFPEGLSGFGYLSIVMVVNIAYGIIQGIQWRRETGGYMGFGAAFKYIFVLLTVNGLVGVIYMAIFLFAVPSYPEQMADAQLQTSLYWAEKFGAPESAIADMEDKFDKKEVTERFGHKGILVGFAFVLIFYALGALIIGLIVRRNKPEVM
jgi:hypothetical protein